MRHLSNVRISDKTTLLLSEIVTEIVRAYFTSTKRRYKAKHHLTVRISDTQGRNIHVTTCDRKKVSIWFCCKMQQEY